MSSVGFESVLVPSPAARTSRAAGTESAIDVAALTAFLDGEHAGLKAEVRAVLRRPEFAYRYDIDRTTYRELIMQRCRALARHGWANALYPDAQGRSDLPRFLAAFETIALSDPNLLIKFGVHFGLFGGAILYLGTRRHHEAYLPRVASMDIVGCYAMTEIGHGSDTRRVETVARYDAATGEFVVDTPTPSARKQFIGNAAMHANMAAVFAQLEVGGERRGVFAFLVPLRDASGHLLPGVHIEDTGPKAGLLGMDNGCLRFTQVRIPRENLLDRFGTVTPDGHFRSDVSNPTAMMLRTSSGGRLAIALGATSAAKAGLTIAVRYALRRRQFGGREEQLLLDYPLHRRRLLPRLAEVYAIDAALQETAEDAQERSVELDPDFEERTSVLKAYATWNAVETLQECREACGGQGYLAPNRVGILRADVDPMTTLEGDNTLLYLFVAKSWLKRLGQTLAEGGPLAVPRHALALWFERIALRLSSRTGTRRPDAEYARRLLHLRERLLLWHAARSVRAPDAKADNQTPLADFAQARAERLALEAICERVRRAPAGLRPVLAPLRDLYALACLQRHAGWLLQHGMIGGRHARRLERQIAALCHRLRPHARALVDGFAIPDECLGAPIARLDTQEEC